MLWCFVRRRVLLGTIQVFNSTRGRHLGEDDVRVLTPLANQAAIAIESVRDEGPGVPPAEQDKIFDRFYRLDHGGRGGLAWRLPGVRWRSMPARCRSTVRPERAQPSTSGCPGRCLMRIVIIADDRDAAEAILISLMLGLPNNEIVTYTNGETALAEMAQCPPDLVLLDVNLPGADGFEVCRRLRVRSSVPIIMLTAWRGATISLVA